MRLTQFDAIHIMFGYNIFKSLALVHPKHTSLHDARVEPCILTTY